MDDPTDARLKYEEHIENGDCTASPEHGCSDCLEAMDAGVIEDPGLRGDPFDEFDPLLQESL